ncbi:MAG: tetratricopeptide repeat protein [Bacteroidaceae bacterium]|nr:tetratricopeptide repeat protein [Bacteroidaceae bacterium]
MRHISLFIFLALSAVAFAQPKDAWKAVATLTTYAADGTQIYSGNVFFTDDAGSVIAPYTPFVKAVRAEVTDSKGHRHQVTRILGASENYGFVRAATDARATDHLVPIAEGGGAARAGSRLFAVGHQRNKKETPLAVTVQKAEPYDAAMFYITSLPADAKYAGLPLIDATGRVVAVVSEHGGEALDVRLATALKIEAATALSAELRALPIPKALPEGETEAMKYVTLLDAIDPTAALTAMGDFVTAYLHSPAGFTTRAARYAAMKRYAEAETDYATALRLAEESEQSATEQMSPDAVHYAFSRAVYAAALSDSTSSTLGWTLGRALQEADAAYSAKPQPLYAMQQGACLYAMERYADAYAKYEEVNASELASDETFFTAVLALERAGGDTAKIMALLDKVISLQKRPYDQRAASYFFERAQRLFAYGQYRRAAIDYDEFERIIGPRNLNDNFYFLREQAELQAHMYQQALDDIQSAILSAPAERKPYYQTEEALIYLTCGEYQSAKESALAAYAAIPRHIPLLRILGVACGELGDKAAARRYLTEAQQQGDDSVVSLLEKYQ